VALEPEPEIVCIDCGGRAFLLSRPRSVGPLDGHSAEEADWLPGDIVAYRCEDCLDRWDLVLPDLADDPDA
jgi:DNA-directed RNA polymerase subunit RPC12/RpoP